MAQGVLEKHPECRHENDRMDIPESQSQADDRHPGKHQQKTLINTYKRKQRYVAEIDLKLEALPDIVLKALSGEWPKTLQGPEIVDIIILIESGVCAEEFVIWREDECENRTWGRYLDNHYTARLETLRIADVEEPEFGCAEQEHAEYFATLTTKAPPIIVEGRRLKDGNHRLEAARLRGEEFIDAYVIS